MLPVLASLVSLAELPPLAEIAVQVGTVVVQRVESIDGRLVTESELRLDDGGTTTVRHRGGTLDGIGMRVVDQPTLALGERAAIWREGPWLRATAPLQSSRRNYVRAATNRSGAALFWDETNCIEMFPDAAGSDDVEPEEAFAALERAAQNWNVATQDCGHMVIAAGAPIPDLRAEYLSGRGNRNVVVWLEDEWPYPELPTAAALTTLHFVDSPDSPQDGQIYDTDIEVNGVGFKFAIDCVDGQGEIDLESTLTHELGHVLGLDHTCADPRDEADRPENHLGEPVPSCFGTLPDEVRYATMFSMSRGCQDFMRTPESDDISGVCSLYPAELDPGTCLPPGSFGGGGGESGGCAFARGPGRLPASAVVLMLLALIRGRACSRFRIRSGCGVARVGRARSSASA